MSFYLAFLLGLLSSAHCAGMCGGLIGALSHNGGAPLRTAKQNQLHLLANNLGRISTYTLAGIIMGYIGAVIGAQLNIPQWSQWLRYFMAVIMLIIGLHLMFQHEGLFQVLERLSAPIWARAQKYWAELFRRSSLLSSYQFGLLWGLLPCGLVYSVLLTATSSGSSTYGALTMLGFGLGTLPALLLTGNLLWYYKRLIGQQYMRQASGVILIISALFIFSTHWLMQYLGPKAHPLLLSISHCI